MRLTKHLYRFEEVRSALLYSIRSRRFIESLFWLEELEESCYSGEARRLLFVAWFLFVGLSRMSWLSSWSDLGSTHEGRRILCIQLCSCSERDSSLWLLIASNALPTPTLPILIQWRQEQSNTIMFDAKQKDPRIPPILEALQKDMKGYSLFAKATAFGIQSCWKQIPQTSWTPLSTNNHLFTEIEAWSQLSMRSRRIYAIPFDSLFGMCWRGIGGDTTDELRMLTKEVFQTSPYWKSKAVWETDEELEEFYDTYFPDDIPDEWSREDQEKSHGAPGFGTVDSPLGRWWRNWIPEESLFVPGAVLSNCRVWASNQTVGNYGSVLDRFLTIVPGA
jgi:hypothetical protein